MSRAMSRVSRRVFSPRWAVVAVAAVMVGGAGCTSVEGGLLSADDRQSALEASAHAPRSFRYSTDRLAEPLAIDAAVEDDYRYRATVSVGGEELYEEVVVDDRRWLRVRGSDQLAAPAVAVAGASPELAPLLEGNWVADAAGTPPEFDPGGAPPTLFGPGPVLDAVRRLDSLASDPEAVERLRRAKLYDPQSSQYLERNDKFDRHEEDGERFDVVPNAYDTEAIFAGGVPQDLGSALEPYALYTSYWIKDGRLTRIETFFDVDVATVRRDLEAAQEAVAASSGTPAPAVPLPRLPQPYRESLTIDYPDRPPIVAAPAAVASVQLPAAPT